MIIVISGTVGVGKSTTVQALKTKLEKMNLKVHYTLEEAAESVYLKHYYDDPTEWAFLAQIDWLMGRFKQSIEINELTTVDSDLVVIQDRHVLDDFVFSKLPVISNSVSKFDRLTYASLYETLISTMHSETSIPDLFVLLKAPLDTVIGRLNFRGREAEMNTEKAFWKTLYDYYYNLPQFRTNFEMNSKKLITIETDGKTPEQIAEEISTHIER